MTNPLHSRAYLENAIELLTFRINWHKLEIEQLDIDLNNTKELSKCDDIK